jgi:hypothetical protein
MLLKNNIRLEVVSSQDHLSVPFSTASITVLQSLIILYDMYQKYPCIGLGGRVVQTKTVEQGIFCYLPAYNIIAGEV